MLLSGQLNKKSSRPESLLDTNTVCAMAWMGSALLSEHLWRYFWNENVILVLNHVRLSLNLGITFLSRHLRIYCEKVKENRLMLEQHLVFIVYSMIEWTAMFKSCVLRLGNFQT